MTKSEAGKLGASIIGPIQHAAALKRYYDDPAMCRHCGSVIAVMPGMRPAETRVKKFCNHTCSAAHNNAKRGDGNRCPICSKKLLDRKKQCCSHTCSEERQYRAYIERWLEGSGSESGLTRHALSEYVRRYCIERAGNKCERCGWAEVNQTTSRVPVQVHHKRGYYENRPDDLEVVCPNCHSLTETFGNLNRGNGRKHRYGKSSGVA